MTRSRLSDIRERARERLEGIRWWVALRVGGAPRCAECGSEAAWIADEVDEPRCFKHIPSEGMEAIRDVQPEDCFTDWNETADDT